MCSTCFEALPPVSLQKLQPSLHGSAWNSKGYLWGMMYSFSCSHQSTKVTCPMLLVYMDHFFARLCKACLHGTIDCQSRMLQCTVMPPAVSWDITVCLLQACRCSYLWPVTGDQLLVTNYLWPVTCGTGYLWDLLLVRPVTCDQLLVEACLHTHSEFFTALQSFWFCQIWV